jgi:hypothetical protein
MAKIASAAAKHFDALLTMDRGIPHQQDLRGLGLRILIIRAPSNSIVHLRPLVGSILKTLPKMSPGEVRQIGTKQTRLQIDRHTDNAPNAPGTRRQTRLTGRVPAAQRTSTLTSA